jgi:hypothetical protein
MNFNPVVAWSFDAHFATCSFTLLVIGISVNLRLTILFPVIRDMNMKLPCRFSVGSRHIPHLVLGSMVFVMSGSAYTSQYAPKGVLQCSFALSLCLDTSSLGCYFSDTPDFTGNEFIHITQKCSSLMMTSFGNILYGRVLIVPLALFFITLIFLLIYPTCSRAAVVLSAMFGSKSFNFSNSMSIMDVWTIKLALP